MIYVYSMYTLHTYTEVHFSSLSSKHETLFTYTEISKSSISFVSFYMNLLG